MRIIVSNEKEQKAIKRVIQGYRKGLGSMPFCMSDIIRPSNTLESYFVDNLFDIKVVVNDKEPSISKDDLSDYDEE